MNTFTDNVDRVWTISVNVATLKRVNSLLKIDPLTAFESESDLLQQLIRNPVLLVDVIYAICKPEADAKNVSDEDFGRGMAGDAIETATQSLFEELAAFFPTKRRSLYKKALTKLDQFQKKAIQMAETKLDSPELNEKLEAILNEELEVPTFGIGSGS